MCVSMYDACLVGKAWQWCLVEDVGTWHMWKSVLEGWWGILRACGFEGWMGVLCSCGFEDCLVVLCGGGNVSLSSSVGM